MARLTRAFAYPMSRNSNCLSNVVRASFSLAACLFFAGGGNGIAATSTRQSGQAAALQPAPVRDPRRDLAASPIDEHRIHNALCSIVYQVDRTAGPRGYHYLFYGNGFFINSDGYILTVAHVLSQLHGGQPYVLLRSPGTAPNFAQASVVALDRDHDIAVLRVTPNPFVGGGAVAFLLLERAPEGPGRKVLSAALRPFKPRDAWTLDPALEERAAGDVLRFETSKLTRGAPGTELFLFNHAVELGQSGAPVLAMDSGGVAGLVEGRWLRDDVGLLTPHDDSADGADSPAKENPVAVPGAAIPIHYAIALIDQKGIAWHEASKP